MIVEHMGIFGLSIHEKIANQILATTATPGMDRESWITWSKTLLPEYQSSVKLRGLPAFEVADASTYPTYKSLADRTGLAPGYVYLYLEALEQLARTGDIKIEEWRPELAPEPGPLATIFAPEPSPVRPEKKTYYWPWVIAGVGVWLLLRGMKKRYAKAAA